MVFLATSTPSVNGGSRGALGRLDQAKCSFEVSAARDIRANEYDGGAIFTYTWMNAASKLGPHTQTDRGACSVVELYITWGFKIIIAQLLNFEP
jgi:hypothetical protein